MWNEYDLKVKSAQQEKDNNKTAFKNETTKEYDNKIKKLFEDGIAIESIWENLVLEEDKKVSDFYKAEDKKYKSTIEDIINWRNGELSKMG